MNTLFTDAILLRTFVLFLMLGSVAGVLAGMLMIWRPEWLASINNYLNRWVSTRKMARPLSKVIDVDRWFYRYGRAGGALLLAGAVYIIYIFTAAQGRVHFLASLNSMHLMHPLLQESILDTLVLVFISGAVLAQLLALFLMFRPSFLKDMELDANKRISLRRALKPMEMQHQNLDQLVFRHALATGILLLCGSLYTLVLLGLWLGK